jgi:hypothetical protein
MRRIFGEWPWQIGRDVPPPSVRSASLPELEGDALASAP